MTSYESTTTRLLHQELNACVLVEDLLPLYIEGEVSPATRDLMVEHLAHCDHCAGFLAGAQSTRIQLRRDNDARARVLAQDRPAQRAVANGVGFFRNLVELGIAALAILFSAAIWSELSQPIQALGPMLALISFFVVIVLVHRHGALTVAHLLKLGAVCIVGAIGAVSLLPFADSPLPFVGMLLVIASMVGLRYLGFDRLRSHT